MKYIICNLAAGGRCWLYLTTPLLAVPDQPIFKLLPILPIIGKSCQPGQPDQEVCYTRPPPCSRCAVFKLL